MRAACSVGAVLARFLPIVERESGNSKLEQVMSRYLPGDVVSRRKGVVMHKGVVLRDGSILHNTPFRGEHVCSEEEFRAGKRLRATRLEGYERRRVLHHAENGDRRRYNLLTNNCEHTVTRAATGSAHSPQLTSWVAGVGLGAVAFALTRHPAITVAGYALGYRLVKKLR